MSSGVALPRRGVPADSVMHYSVAEMGSPRIDAIAAQVRKISEAYQAANARFNVALSCIKSIKDAVQTMNESEERIPFFVCETMSETGEELAGLLVLANGKLGELGQLQKQLAQMDQRAISEVQKALQKTTSNWQSLYRGTVAEIS